MKLHLISENQLKIYLDNEDIKKYDISYDNIDYENSNTRRLFWSIMQTAKEEKGFDAYNSRLILETAYCENGGLIMTVTRTEKKPTFYKIKRYLSQNKPREKRFIDTFIFTFDNIEDLITCCSIQDISKDTLTSSIYELDGKLYLCLFIPRKPYCSNVVLPDSLNFLNEFGFQIHAKNFFYILEERAKPIILADAVDKIKSIFRV